MKNRFQACVSALVLAGAFATPSFGDDRRASPAGRVNNLKVLSDKIDDLTTPENILKAFVKPSMSDAERAQAIWRGTVKYRHQTSPPNEYLAADWEAHDPVKIFNTYGSACAAAARQSWPP